MCETSTSSAKAAWPEPPISPGSVTGLTGPAAAGAAGIVPNPNSNFRFNQCAIQSVSCILLPGEAVPTANPLNDINIGTLFNPNEDEDLLLPIVSDQDY